MTTTNKALRRENTHLKTQLAKQVLLIREIMDAHAAEVHDLKEEARKEKAKHEAVMTQVHLAHHRKVSNLESALRSYQEPESGKPSMGFIERFSRAFSHTHI